MTGPTTMTRRSAPRPLPRPALMFTLMFALVLSACSSVAGTSPGSTPAGSSTGPTVPSSAAPSTEAVDPTTEIFELHYRRSTIAGTQSEHTATVLGGGQVEVADQLDGTQHRFELTQAELARLGELLPVLADAPEPTSVVSDVGSIDATFSVAGRKVAVTVDDWSMAGGTARLPADERVVADAMIELRDLLIREPAGSVPTTGATPTS